MKGRAYSVEQVNKYIRGLLINEPFLQDIRVKGEISNLKYHSSGHIYFDIKDSSGKLSAAMFRNYQKGLTIRMHEGDGIIATGDIDLYPKNGSYQLIVRRVEPAGEGDLYARFERLKEELSEMGMFDASYKKPLPSFVFHVGIVTAPTGAAIQDMIRIIKRRNKCVRITLYPATVQGEGAAGSVAAGIEALNEIRPDVIIAGRGGGSIEDLWAFNEEEVARAIFSSEVPIISAVGHETDTTIADFVADIRAATPSEAAELAVPQYDALMERLLSFSEEFYDRIERMLFDASQRLDNQEEKLLLLHPEEKLAALLARHKTIKEELNRRMDDVLLARRHRLSLLAQRLDDISPIKRLSGGFAWLSDKNGRPVLSVKDVAPKDEINARLSDGRLSLKVTTAEGDIWKI